MAARTGPRLTIWRKRCHIEFSATFVAVRDEWIKDWKSGIWNDLRRLYAPDAVFLPALGVEIRGRDAICDYLRQINNSSKGDLFVVPDGSDEVSGDMAYDSGFMPYWIKETVAPIKGSYLMVLKRDSDGSWQIVRRAFAGISVHYDSNSK
jgi:ketosteroid isomerase-like protein